MKMQQRGPSAFTVVALLSATDAMECGHFDNLEEARDRSDGLRFWEIWQGDHIVAESHPAPGRSEHLLSREY